MAGDIPGMQAGGDNIAVRMARELETAVRNGTGASAYQKFRQEVYQYPSGSERWTLVNAVQQQLRNDGFHLAEIDLSKNVRRQAGSAQTARPGAEAPRQPGSPQDLIPGWRRGAMAQTNRAVAAPGTPAPASAEATRVHTRSYESPLRRPMPPQTVQHSELPHLPQTGRQASPGKQAQRPPIDASAQIHEADRIAQEALQRKQHGAETRKIQDYIKKETTQIYKQHPEWMNATSPQSFIPELNQKLNQEHIWEHRPVGHGAGPRSQTGRTPTEQSAAGAGREHVGRGRPSTRRAEGGAPTREQTSPIPPPKPEQAIQAAVKKYDQQLDLQAAALRDDAKKSPGSYDQDVTKLKHTVTEADHAQKQGRGTLNGQIWTRQHLVQTYINKGTKESIGEAQKVVTQIYKLAPDLETREDWKPFRDQVAAASATPLHPEVAPPAATVTPAPAAPTHPSEVAPPVPGESQAPPKVAAPEQAIKKPEDLASEWERAFNVKDRQPGTLDPTAYASTMTDLKAAALQAYTKNGKDGLIELERSVNYAIKDISAGPTLVMNGNNIEIHNVEAVSKDDYDRMSDENKKQYKNPVPYGVGNYYRDTDYGRELTHVETVPVPAAPAQHEALPPTADKAKAAVAFSKLAQEAFDNATHHPAEYTLGNLRRIVQSADSAVKAGTADPLAQLWTQQVLVMALIDPTIGQSDNQFKAKNLAEAKNVVQKMDQIGHVLSDPVWAPFKNLVDQNHLR